jgi:hypothetical protein
MHEWSTPSALGKFGLTPFFAKQLATQPSSGCTSTSVPARAVEQTRQAPPQVDCNATISMNEVKLRNRKFGSICDQLIPFSGKVAAVAVLVRESVGKQRRVTLPLNNNRRTPYLSRQAIESHCDFWTEIDPRVRRASYRKQVAFERATPGPPPENQDGAQEAP